MYKSFEGWLSLYTLSYWNKQIVLNKVMLAAEGGNGADFVVWLDGDALIVDDTIPLLRFVDDTHDFFIQVQPVILGTVGGYTYVHVQCMYVQCSTTNVGICNTIE